MNAVLCATAGVHNVTVNYDKCFSILKLVCKTTGNCIFPHLILPFKRNYIILKYRKSFELPLRFESLMPYTQNGENFSCIAKSMCRVLCVGSKFKC
jgi:hypothetical protein